MASARKAPRSPFWLTKAGSGALPQDTRNTTQANDRSGSIEFRTTKDQIDVGICGGRRVIGCVSGGNVTAKPAKDTKRNPRHWRETSEPQNSTGGNRENRESIPPPFAPLPPGQTARCALAAERRN